MFRGQIPTSDFYCYYNGGVYKTDWLKNPKFKVNEKVRVGIDQSSTRTGLTIKSKNPEELDFIVELPRGEMSLVEYKRVLTHQLDIYLWDLDVEHFIYEKHGNHISPLHSMINEITDTIKTYSKDRFGRGVNIKGVLPPVWRSGFLPKEIYKGNYKREQVKLACAEECIRLDTKKEKYRKYCSKDFDGFESTGIIDGYLNLNYNKEGNRLINTTMEYNPNRNVYYQIFLTSYSNLEQTVSNIKSNYAGSLTEVIYGSESLLLENSFNRALEDYKKVIVILKNTPEICRLILETKEHYDENKDVFVAYIHR